MLMRSAVVGLVALVSAANAQGPGRGPGMRGGRADNGPPPDARVIGGWAGHPNRVVKNAPYSADAVTETTQKLADGNVIRQTVTAKFYRDSEGRERNEQTLGGLGALAPGANLPPVVYINDPVAGVDYALNARDKTVMRTNRGRGGPEPFGGGRGQRRNPDSNGPPPPMGGRFGGRGGPGGAAVKTDSLGKQTIEGVPAEGTRTTVTFPAGSQGNEQPITIMTESWYSPDLQVVVLSRHTDPRSGETVFRLTNISRAEPPASLFQPPPDYKVVQGGMPPRGQMPPGH